MHKLEENDCFQSAEQRVRSVFSLSSRSKDLQLEEEGGILLEMLRFGYFEPTHRTDNDYFLLRSAYANPIQFIDIQYVSIYFILLIISRRLSCFEELQVHFT